MPPTVAFTAAAARSSPDSDAHEGRLKAALQARCASGAALPELFPQVRCTVTPPATPLHPTPTPLVDALAEAERVDALAEAARTLCKIQA